MEYDEYLAGRLLEGTGGPTVRVYGWKPFAISLGYHQDVNEFDLEKCRKDGIEVVHRPTGGWAILHAHELTYSVVMYADGWSVALTYESVGHALVMALRYLGVEVEMSRTAPGVSEVHHQKRSVSCFASTSRSEIQYRGRKIVGSAQRRYASPNSQSGTVILQHGSVLLGQEHRRLAQYITDVRAQSILQAVLEHKTTEVESILQRPVSFDEAADAFRRGFEEAWDIRFADGEAEDRLEDAAVQAY